MVETVDQNHHKLSSIKGGLVSVTFRSLSPKEIVERVAEAQLEGIEWGGDIHVPEGELQQAKQVRQMTEAAGLEVAAYGSYYRVVDPEGQAADFRPTLDSAVALGAPLIRVWAGQTPSNRVSVSYRQHLVEQLNHIGSLAREVGITIGIEYHGNTLTDTPESVQQLISQIDHEHVNLYWQPPPALLSQTQQYESLLAILHRLAGIHVYHWQKQDTTLVRHSLAEGEVAWLERLRAIRTADTDLFAMLEFVKDDSVEQFLADAATLKKWLAM